MQATEQEIREAFTEWDRRYRANPEKFMSEAVHLLKQTAKDYGEAVTPYFINLLAELKANAE